MSLRVALYVRLSDQDREGHRLGFESTRTQEELLREEAARLGWTIVEVLVDDGISGQLVGRPQFQRLGQLARARSIDAAMFLDLDRFSRLEPARTISTLLELNDLGVRSYDAGQRQFVALSGPESIMTWVRAMQAQGEAKKTGERIKRGLRQRARDGRAIRLPPLGYRMVTAEGTGKRWEIDPEGAAVVHYIVEVFLRTKSLGRTAAILNKEKVHAPKGGMWWAFSIRAIAERPVYRGYVLHGRVGIDIIAGKPKRVERDPSEVLRVEHPELRILDEETCAKIDAALAVLSREPKTGRQPRFLATWLVTCSYCGGTIARSAGKRSNGSLCCDRARLKGCGGPLGYKSERRVNAAWACRGFVDTSDRSA